MSVRTSDKVLSQECKNGPKSRFLDSSLEESGIGNPQAGSNGASAASDIPVPHPHLNLSLISFLDDNGL